MFDRNFVNPSVGQLEEAVRTATETANSGARARLARLLAADDIRRVLAEPMGWMQADGGGVPNSYNNPASTSCVSVVWFTDHRGNKHVRVRGRRMNAPSGPWGNVPVIDLVRGLDLERYGDVVLVGAVYPELRFDWRRGSLKGPQKGFLQAMHDDPLDLAARAAYADWLEEQSEMALDDNTREAMKTQAEYQRSAVAKLREIEALPAPKAASDVPAQVLAGA